MKDIIIVGGGIVGLWCARHLSQAGYEVTVMDRSDMSDGCSYGNAGMIVPSHFIPLASPGMIAKGLRWMFKTSSPFYIRPRLSPELFQWLWWFYRASTQKHVEASIELLRDLHTESREIYLDLQEQSGFDFQLEKKGILMLYRSSGAERDELEVADMAHTLGIEARHLSPWDLIALDPGIQMDVKGAVHYPGDAHFNPERLMSQLKISLRNDGTTFLPAHEVVHVEDHGGLKASVSCANGTMHTARHVIIASGSWSGRLMKKQGYRMPMQDGKGYSVTVHHAEVKPSIPAILHEARVAVTPMGDSLRISGTLEISGMDETIRPAKVAGILDAMPKYYPGFKSGAPGPVWYGYRPCAPDGLPYLGYMRKDAAVVVATGHAMMGMSLAPVTGRIVKDLIEGRNTIHPKLAANRFNH